ncbi:hypothetical protein CFC21_104828 [Triticum aestivum]|uniref:Dolichyl-diphosphooligosaccharide--protein glycosyltransferase subunit DAD1 n=2 Tax=Triticum aestivum TaxID=4565 RepID=A0A3B6SR32_WHEAT|nr:dolichyl-diphosphooligosaccharide--protein glycosyltransferase subunit DAD2-like isoform X3 [Triticum dicoccoides]XP_037468283.1 dolichyl-diphosphooligosaccharide--protein glycosyltransferase subunit DAD2-like isoform X3 [Triticum dicoccoides]XP_037468284.1 dolichyl-diphosphooligosaccharide--protein glycosyltransferase subunit DAD2-like isoform X3 [Triticum dicoccoides]XP_044434399.1 dolichyl-diphosphooligosaccharide--protein glycosyltransferase subunit DAD2-like isoform X3 [Triticum aestivum
MPKADGDATLLIQSLNKAYAATPTNLKIIDLYVVFAVVTALVQVGYMGIVGSLPFNSFLSGVLSCIGTAVLAACLRIQVNKDNKEFKDLPPERAFADFVLCNLVLHLVIHSTSVLELYQTPGRDTIPDFSHLIQGTLTYGNNGKEVKKN